MKKLHGLRAALTASMDRKHGLDDWSRLQVIASNLTLVATGRPGSSFQHAYTIELHFPGFTGDPIEISVPLLIWIQRHQPDLLTSREAAERGIDATFVPLDAQSYDVHIAVQVAENVRFTPRPGGGHDVEYLDEPAPMFLETGTPLHAVYLDGELIVHCEAHPGAGL